MFVIKQSASYFYPVKLELVGADGTPVKAAFDAEFKRLSQSDLEDLLKKVNTGELDDKAFVAMILVGWRGVCNEDGSEIQYSQTARDNVLNVFPARPAVIDAFYESIKAGRRGN